MCKQFGMPLCTSNNMHSDMTFMLSTCQLAGFVVQPRVLHGALSWSRIEWSNVVQIELQKVSAICTKSNFTNVVMSDFVIPARAIAWICKECCSTFKHCSSTTTGHQALCHTSECSKEQGPSFHCDSIAGDCWLLRSSV